MNKAKVPAGDPDDSHQRLLIIKNVGRQWKPLRTPTLQKETTGLRLIQAAKLMDETDAAPATPFSACPHFGMRADGDSAGPWR